MTIQTFGDYARWNPHIHAIVADGLFTPGGDFYFMPRVSLTPLAEMFRATVFQMLRERGLMDDRFMAKLMGWRHTSGFSVHNGLRIAPDDAAGQEALAQYIIRSPFSTAKMTYNEPTGRVIYCSKMTHGKNRRNFELFSAVEFIAVPVEGIEIIDVADYRPRTIPSPTWRECIKKIWEVDSLECPKCHGEMKIISFITDSSTIRKILLHLRLWERPPPGKADLETTNDDDQHPDLIYEPLDDGWSEYEESRLLQPDNRGAGAVCAISPLSVRPTGINHNAIDEGV